jgi:uncharacterized SAM-binding protein YcdF (DUF218 family)
LYYYLSKFLTPIILPVNFIIIILLFSFFFKKLKKIFYSFLFLFIFISIFPVGDFLTYHILNKNFIDGKNSKDFDSILILGGDERRILHGFSLLKLNPNAKIIFSGGSALLFPDEKQIENDERKSFSFLIESLVKQNKIITLNQSRNTYENLVNFKKIKNESSFNKTIVVTDIWHYKRVLKISDKISLKLTPFYYLKSDNRFDIFQSYQFLDFAGNLVSFNRFFREIYGILGISII